MTALRTQIVGNRDLSGRFARVVSERRKASRAFAGQHAQRVADRWGQRTRSSRVRAAIRVRPKGASSFVVEADSRDVGFPPHVVEHDTVPHVISPTKSHGLLVFKGRGGGTVFIRGSVEHPGTRGDHALARALADLREGYRAGITRIWGGASI